MRSTAHALSFVSRRSNAIGGFRSPSFWWVLIFQEVWLQFVPWAVCCRTGLRSTWSLVSASGISIPSSFLTRSEWSSMWIASLTLLVYQCESRSVNFTSFQSGDDRSCERVQKWRRSGYGPNVYPLSCSFLLSYIGLPVSPNVDFAAFTGNPVKHAVLSSWIDNVLWSY